MRIIIAILCLLAPLLTGACVAVVPDYINFYATKAGDGFNGVLVVQNREGYAIGPISGNLTIEVYVDSDYQNRIFMRSFDVPSSGWSAWGVLLPLMPAWYVPTISYGDIGDNLNLSVKAIFRPTDTPEREFTAKTLVL